MNSRTPENLIRHPITDSRETALHQQDGFDWCFTMAIQKSIDKLPVEPGRNDFGNIDSPTNRAMLFHDGSECGRIGVSR